MASSDDPPALGESGAQNQGSHHHHHHPHHHHDTQERPHSHHHHHASRKKSFIARIPLGALGRRGSGMHYLGTKYEGPIKQFKLDEPDYSFPLVRIAPMVDWPDECQDPSQDAKDIAEAPPKSPGRTMGAPEYVAGGVQRLRFVLRAGAPPLAESGKGQAVLITNYPVSVRPEEACGAFQRSTYSSLPFSYDHVNDAFVELDVALPGSFEYFVAWGNGDSMKHGSSGWILVEPSLAVRGNVLPSLDALVLQTVVPKWMGPIPGWNAQFSIISQLHFNMVHFVPLQVRGVSNSPYSLYDQLDLDHGLFEGCEPEPKTPGERFQHLHEILHLLEYAHGLLAMTDVVWNHTACNSKWLREHPESGYNLVNSPHLWPAYELDEAIMRFSAEIAEGRKYPNLSARLISDEQLSKILAVFRNGPFQALRLWEYFVLDVAGHKKDVMAHCPDHNALANDCSPDSRFRGAGSLGLRPRALLLQKYALETGDDGVRFRVHLRVDDCLAYLRTWWHERMSMYEGHQYDLVPSSACSDADSCHHRHINKSPESSRASSPVREQPADSQNVPQAPPNFSDLAGELEAVLNEINLDFYKQYDEDVRVIFNSLENTIRWQRLNNEGPILGPITSETPLVWSYFTRGYTDSPAGSLVAEVHFKPEMAWANNGWIWNANPLVDFASRTSRAYFRREVIVWGDCVKLRYGSGPDDAPWLWEHMSQYTRKMAKHFHAFRIDNCHSTPRHVAQYLLDQARKIRPNLYVVAELFTGDAEIDRTFVAQLGINSLIREAMQAWDPRELSRIVHRYSGDPVGSFRAGSTAAVHSMTHPHKFLDVKPSDPHALFMDCTHDNETPAQKRTVADTLSNAALVAMTCSAMGSTLGYDLCIPHNLDIVKESRRYPQLTLEQGMHPVRQTLNALAVRMSNEHLSEIYVHHEDQWIIVYRQNPITHRGIVMVTRTAFRSSSGAAYLSPVVLRKTKANLLSACSLECTSTSVPEDKSIITGYPVRVINQNGRVKLEAEQNAPDNMRILLDPNTPPGTVFIFETWLTTGDHLHALHDLETLEGTKRSGIAKLTEALALGDLAVLLYQCENEEKERGGGIYDIPGSGHLPYAGIAGIAQILRTVMRQNDLGHPMCSNLREGAWLMDYSVGRLVHYIERGWASPALREVADWMRDRFALVKTVPNYLVPKYFSVVLMTVEVAARKAIFGKMGRFIFKSPTFVHNLALVSLQMLNTLETASLHPTKRTPSLAAGLPHFTTHHMRCWGRDIFISLKGLLLLTNQFDVAREHLVMFAGCIRHGLIPNLLDSGRYPRYNARDAVWWWTQALQDYCSMSPEGTRFLSHSVARRFPEDTWVHWEHPDAYSRQSTILEILLEVVQRHASGIKFREWNAGPNLDHAMASDGFNVNAFIDWGRGGFVFGGNRWNCGTWMDKMGDSEKAGNKGKPATPRDGADVELQGLLFSCVSWLDNLHKSGSLVNPGVTKEDGTLVSWESWKDLMRTNFERLFYIPLEEETTQQDFAVQQEYVRRRGMFKDTVGACDPQRDYHFRPNQFVAMAVAPKLFSLRRAMNALSRGLDILAGPLGMRTLDPNDPDYSPYYDNSNDGTDPAVAHGWNYHQGPEWTWLTGHFYRAYLTFASEDESILPEKTHQERLEYVLQRINSKLIPVRVAIANSPWAGLPELTNKNGSECHGSCPTQAWSAATMLELDHDMFKQRETVLNRSLTIEFERSCDLE